MGLNPVMVGVVLITVKVSADVTVLLLTVTLIGPVASPSGIPTVIIELVGLVATEKTVRATPLSVTTLSEIVVLKFVPVMVTVV